MGKYMGVFQMLMRFIRPANHINAVKTGKQDLVEAQKKLEEVKHRAQTLGVKVNVIAGEDGAIGEHQPR